jgi:hypothetical protein
MSSLCVEATLRACMPAARRVRKRGDNDTGVANSNNIARMLPTAKSPSEMSSRAHAYRSHISSRMAQLVE